MTLPLTPALLEAAYQFLCKTPPFNRWKMPASLHIKFHVTRSADDRGYADGDHSIGVSSRNIGRTESLLAVMTHEMIHVYNHSRGHRRSEHGAEFKRCARLVCKYHGFDLKLF